MKVNKYRIEVRGILHKKRYQFVIMNVFKAKTTGALLMII